MKKIPWVDIVLWIQTLFLVWIFGNQGWSEFSVGHPGQLTSEVVPLALSLIVLVGRRQELTAWRARWPLPAE